MKYLTVRETDKLLAEAQKAATSPDRWNAWYTINGEKTATVEFPVGELFNPGIAGYLLAWKMMGSIEYAPITERDRFNANGLEGKIIVNTSLTTALNVYRELTMYRCQLRM